MRKLAFAMTHSLWLSAAFFAGAASAEAPCEGYLQEAEAVSGVSPRFDQDGSFRSIVSYATGSFVVSKPQLIDAARSLAEMSAKKNLASWMAEQFSSESESSNTVTQTETVDAEGNGSARADSLMVLSEAYRSDADALLRNVFKLDECVDPEARVVYVALGWKPDPAPVTITPGAEDASADVENSLTSSSGGVVMMQVSVEGFGADETIAVNEALRVAVSQVYGEKFVSTLSTRSIISITEDMRSDLEGTSGAFVSQSVDASTFSETAGIVSGFRIISVEAVGEGVSVRLNVDIPRYQLPDLGNAQKMIVLPPTLLPTSTARDIREYLPGMQREIESLLTKSEGLRILNRENLPALDLELGAIASEGTYRTEEAAKLGNRLGADLVLITELGRIDIDRETRTLGSRQVEIAQLRGDVWIKVINVVTTDTVFALRFPVSGAGPALRFELGDVALAIGGRVAQAVGEAIGGGFRPDLMIMLESAGVNAGQPQGSSETDQVTRRNVEAVKKEISNDW